MKTRKIAIGLTVFALVGAMVLPVSAQEKTDSTTIKANIASTYTLTIPKETTVKFNALSTDLNGTLKVAGNVLPTQQVTVTAQANDFHNAVQNANLPYTLVNKEDNKTFTTATWNETELRNGLISGQGKAIQLSIDLLENDWNTAKAGDYTGTITFTADLK